MNAFTFRRFFLELPMLGLLATGLFAQTPSPDAWTFRDGSVVTTQRELRLPAGTDISRTLTGDPVGLRVVSKPHFSATPSGWPMISVAGSTLTFFRDGAGGGVILVGDSMLPLPLRVDLDAAGRSLLTVDVTMTVSQSQSIARVAILGQPAAEVKTTVSAGPVVLTIAAGSSESWQIAILEEIPPSAAAVGGDASADGGVSSSSTTKAVAEVKEPSQRRFDALRTAIALARGGGKVSEIEAAIMAGNREKPGTFAWNMETAAALVQVALAVQLRYDFKGAEALALRSLEILASGKDIRSQVIPEERAGGAEMAGFIHEQFFHDEKAARFAYAEAAELDPKSVQARQAVSRLDGLKAMDARSARKN